MKRLAHCLALLMACHTAAAADAIRTDFYTVDGNSVRSIRAALNANGPLGEDGKRYHGYTKWHVSWNFTHGPSAGGCAIRSVNVDTSAVMTLPRLAKPDALPDSLRMKWNSYSVALRAHEDGHRAIALAAAGEIRRRLSQLASSGGCKALADEANRAAQAVLADFRVRERQYDRDTDHGATEGARF